MCERVIRRNIVFCLLLGVFLQLSIGDREIIFQRFRRQSSKAGRCPPWTMIRNCSSKEQCNWDGDCFGGQKCCVSTCETRSCHEPVAMIGPHEDVCPRDEALQMSNRGNCHPVRTRFCFKTNCKRCCFHYSTCNPNPDKLMSKDDCREVLCSSTLCEFPGEICILDKFNSPRCACRSRCPAPRPGEDVCGTDGIPYKSACELNRTACILGARDIKIHSYGNCRLNGAKVKISAAHKRMQILPMRKQGKLTCQFEGDPVSITWEKVGLRTLPDRMVPRLNNLDILNVDMTDGGLYKCMAYDGFSKAQAEINVTVSGPDSKPDVNLPFKDCSKHPISGYCDRFVVRWYFDWKNGVCRTFAYGGCGGNKNNFPTQQSCNSACGHAAADACNLPVKIGPCKGLMLRWFYNSNTSRCEQFVYGGCNGNANRFNTKAHCQRRCKAKLSLNSPCLRQRLETRRSGSHVFIPTCQPDGRYDAVQCNESVCFCVDDNGKEIVGTRVSRQHHLNCTKSTANPTDSLTQCQMARQNSSRYPFGSSHLIRCKQDGSYQQIQCSGTTGYCWCVDENGFKLTGTETRGSLRCPVLGGRSTLCQRQYLESLRNPQPNQYTPRCQQDGKFERVQCQENRCFCVDTESGRVLRDTSVSMLFGEPRCDNKGHGLTLCQLLHEEAVANPSDEIYIPQCKRNGSFENVQCHGLSKECWCVNREGRELTGTRTNGTISCSGLGKAVTKCQREYQNILRNFPPSITRYVPRCSADGTYEQIQCSGAVCYCVTPQGQQISGTKTFSYTRRPNCTQSDANDRACEKRRQEAFLSSKRFIPFCKPDGSWSEIQCEHFSKLCWCVDSTGKEVPGTKSRNLKTCPDLGCHQFSGTMSPCRKRVLNLLKSGNPRRHVPWCKVDGSYNPLQCYGSYCYCVYENGYEQPGTKISVALGRPLCTRTGGRVSECQRKNQEALAKPNQNEFLPRCKSDGRYEEVQCQSSSGECWCVDQEGKEIPRTRTAKILKCPVIVDQLTSCQRMYLKYAKNPHTSKMIPRCRRDGTFEPMQCKGLDCFCVDSKGMEINGTSLPVRLGKPKCGTRGDDVLTLCQKQQMKAIKNTTRLSRFIPTCKRDGRFEEIQCLRSSGECWCVDEQGKEINGSRTANHLRCPSRASPLTQCEMEQQEILRGWIVPGPYIPQCADDGRYNPIQCQGQYCYCVNGYGVELVESRVHITEGRPHCYDGGALITLCQSQFRDFLRQPITGRFEPRCSSTGAFQEVQCHGKECFCVNREGSEIPNTRQIISMGKLVCPQQGNSLTKCQKQLQEAIHLPPDPKRLVPQCKFNGNYEEIQCNKSSGLCWCVEKDMKEIPSTVTNQTVHCPPLETNSLCWTRYQQNIRKGIHIPWCMPDGSFSPLQIQGSRFFCVNVKGGEVPGTSVDVSQGKPDCHAANSRGYIATPCQREQARRSYLPLQAGKPVPSCKVDGSYDEVQCDVIIGQCWCVNGEGREIHGTRSEGIIRCPDKVSLTPCQKRQERAQKLSASGPDSWIFVPRCQDDGSYYKVQCFPSTGQCWCADINGNERWGTLMQGQPDCSVNVTTCQRHRIRALGLAGSPPLGTYVPRCNPDGSYSDVQCHAFTGICWCVNEKGHEIPGTKNWGWSQCLRRDGGTPLDLGIVIDVSESSAANWTRTLNFVHSVVGSFNISASGTHLGLIAFSSKAEIELYFNTFLGANLTVEKVKTVVSTLLPREGPIRFEEALLLAEEELFRQENGMREGVSKTLLLVTRSSLKRSQGPHTPLSASAQALKDRGISMYTIGIGHNVELSELMDLASDYRNVFTADDLSVLQSSGKILTEIIKNNTNYGVTKEGLCNMPPEPGQLGCLASNLAYYYEAVSGECQSFIYSGCGGNANNFNSYEKCMNYCKGILPSCIDEGNRVASLQLHHYSPTCKTNGRYEDVQCFRKTGYCWCVDEFGKEIMGTRIMGIPICSLATTFGKLTPCLEERQKALGMNGVSSVGRFAPECNPNGEYAQIQCFGNTNFCWCSDKQGYEIAGTHRWGTPDCPVEVRPGECPFIQNPAECHTLMSNQTCLKDSDCSESYKCCDCGCVRRCTLVPQYEPAPVSNCLREHVKSLSSSCPHFKAVGRFFPSCKSNGDYEEWQCNEHYGVCWCVDRDGNEIPGTRQKGKPDCEKLVAMKPCQRERMRAMAMRTRTVVGMFIPSCQPDGSYNLIQCHNVTGFCWCVDNLGNIMTGTRQWGKPNCTRISQTDKRPTVCQSRRDECLENAPRGHFIPRCKADGSFEERQCLHLTRECWCVDRSGNELPGTRSLNTRDCSLLAWLSPCQIQRRQALGPRGVPVVGLVAPECKADGGYENLQCDMTSGYCWCLDEYGNEVPESRVKRRPSCAKEPPCKKEMEEILSSFQNPPPGMFVPQCRDDGGYQSTQCHGSSGYCWCVDEYGNELIDTRVRGQRNCSALKHRSMSLCYSDYNKATEVNEHGHHVPQCGFDGSYKQMQCNRQSGECWCVDKNGKEKPETRTTEMPHCQLKEEKVNCKLPPDAGPCTANMPSWFFNKTAEACEVFIYGGCGGNSNRFPSYYDCQDNCKGHNLTFCELQRAINSVRSEEFIPDCKANGEFEEVQCNRITGECWCVDTAGIEILDSRTIGSPYCHELEEIGSRKANSS